MNGDTPKLTRRQQRILRAARSGKPPAVMASRFQCSPDTIRREISRMRAKGEQIEHFNRSEHRAPAAALKLPRPRLAALRREAKRRGLSTRALAEKIIAGALAKGMVADLVDGAGE